MSLLSGKRITELRETGLVVIEPFDPAQVGSNSYDVRLGEWFYREQHPLAGMPVYNPYSEEDVRRVWGQVERAQPYGRLVREHFLPEGLDGFADDDLVILLAPGETILCHTVEFIGGRSGADGVGVVPCMHARSSLARSLMCSHKGAGYGDVGYFSRWTMEVTSFAQHHWIPLKVGSRVAQIAFHLIGNCSQDYGERGAYQAAGSVEDVMRAWRPESMLPRFRL